MANVKIIPPLFDKVSRTNNTLSIDDLCVTELFSTMKTLNNLCVRHGFKDLDDLRKFCSVANWLFKTMELQESALRDFFERDKADYLVNMCNMKIRINKDR